MNIFTGTRDHHGVGIKIKVNYIKKRKEKEFRSTINKNENTT